MKYLKTYEGLFNFWKKKKSTSDFFLQGNESLPKDIEQDLKDICLELRDIGFNTYIYYHNNQHILQITYKKPNTEGDFRFEYKEVEEVVERIKDYMSSKEYRVYVHGTTNREADEARGYDFDAVIIKFNKI